FTRRGFTLIELLAVIAIIGILAAILFPAVSAVRKRAKIATSQTTFQQWCTAVNRYKNTYGFYPNIGGGGTSTYDTSADSVFKLEDGTGLKFIQAMQGKSASGKSLDPTQRTNYNRNAESFCAFAKDDFISYGSDVDSKGLLCDRFGNINIRLIFDTDSTGSIKRITSGILAKLPDDLSSAKSENQSGIDTTVGIPARVIIFTTKNDAATSDGVSPTPTALAESDAADIIAIQ
ncbi:prepilin-type N-terminal cleavage/methylation domain-containing protein, partial [bacterium]|nr:prepilin-type N-terminal cleavage/methylation domain-containing protein [bacterium]